MVQRETDNAVTESQAVAAGFKAGTLTPQEFQQIAQLAHERYGLNIKEGKEELVAGRLLNIIRRLGFSSFNVYYKHVLSEKSGEAITEMIDALTTNHTGFLRERAHFDILQQLAKTASGPTLRVWSAACSTGEEPYTITLSLLDAWKDLRSAPTLQLLATDISTRALRIAQRGVYPLDRARVFPEEWHSRYLLRGTGEWAEWVRMKPEVTRLVEFRRLNLVDPFSHPHPFHVIFCRNVMMYFDKNTQEGLVNRLADCLEPGGHLFVGHSESLTAIKHPLEYLSPAAYRKPGKSSVFGGLT